MARPLFSARLFVDPSLNAGITFVFVAPLNEVWVIRDMVATSLAGDDFTVGRLIVRDGGGTPLWALPRGRAVGLGSFHWDGRQVFEPGDTCEAETDHAGEWALAISGYRLTL